jgi:hypothetical protein
MNGPKSKPRIWRWKILPQEGDFHLMIFSVAFCDKSFLAYSGIGDGEHVSEVTNTAMWRMRPVAGDNWFLDVRKKERADWRVFSAFREAKDDGAVLFLSPDDRRCSEVVKTILKGKRMGPIA